jgi:hypothetical protein
MCRPTTERVRAAAVLALIVVTAHAQTAGDADAFRSALLRALSDGDRTALAAMFRFPATVTVPGLPEPVAVTDEAALARMYDVFFTREMRCIVEESRVAQRGRAAPKYPLTVAGAVVTIGHGTIVAEQTPAGLRITRMAVVGRPGNPAARKAPPQVNLRLGGVWQYSGRLDDAGAERLTLSLTQGTQLEAKLEGFKGTAATVHLLNAGGTPVTGDANRPRVWNGTIPASGDYYLEVRRAVFCDPSVTYVLTVTVR